MDYTVPATRFRRELNKWIRHTQKGDRMIVTLNGKPIVTVEAFRDDDSGIEDRLRVIRQFRGRLAANVRVDRDLD